MPAGGVRIAPHRAPDGGRGLGGRGEEGAGRRAGAEWLAAGSRDGGRSRTDTMLDVIFDLNRRTNPWSRNDGRWRIEMCSLPTWAWLLSSSAAMGKSSLSTVSCSVAMASTSETSSFIEVLREIGLVMWTFGDSQWMLTFWRPKASCGVLPPPACGIGFVASTPTVACWHTKSLTVISPSLSESEGIVKVAAHSQASSAVRPLQGSALTPTSSRLAPTPTANARRRRSIRLGSPASASPAEGGTHLRSALRKLE